MRSALSGRRLAVYLFLCAVWGSTWLAIKIGLADLPPLLFAGVRMSLACVLLTPFALATPGRRTNPREAVLVGFSGLLQIGVAYALIFVAAQWIESGLTALLYGSFPIWAGLFGHFLLRDEPLTGRAVAAAGLGLAGIALIEASSLHRLFRADRPGPLLAGGALVVCSAMVAAFANVLNKRSFPDVSPIVNVWGQTLTGGALLLALAALFERGAPARWTTSALFCVAYLAVFGTALTFAGLFWLIPRVPVMVVGSIPLVDTLIAVLLGGIVLEERLSLRVLAGGCLILAGVLLVAIPRRRRASGAG